MFCWHTYKVFDRGHGGGGWCNDTTALAGYATTLMMMMMMMYSLDTNFNSNLTVNFNSMSLWVCG